MFPFRPIFCKFSRLIEKWGRDGQVTFPKQIYYVFMTICGLIVDIFEISTFSMGFMLFFLLHLMEIFPMTHNFWKKKILFSFA